MQAISWFCNLYMQELLELKKVLNSDLEQLTTVRYLNPCLSIYIQLIYFVVILLIWMQDFKELKATLQKQQDDVTASLKNLGVSIPAWCLVLKSVLRLFTMNKHKCNFGRWTIPYIYFGPWEWKMSILIYGLK